MRVENNMKPLLQLFAMLLAGLVLGSVIQLYLLGNTPPNEAAVEKPLLLLSGMMAFQVLTFAIPALVWGRIHNRALFAIIQSAVAIRQVVFAILFCGAVFFVANEFNAWTIHFLTERGSQLISGLDAQMQVYQSLFANPDLLWLNLLVFGVVPAFAEELFFRGVLYNYLKKRLNSFFHAAIISSLLFAGMHMQIVQIIPIFILGFALAVIYQATGRIWIAMLLHATNNVIQVVSLMHNNEFAWGGLWILIPLLVALLLFRKIIVSPGFRQINKDLS